MPGLLPCAGHYDALAKKAPSLEPIQLVPQLDHLANHGYGRQTNVRFGGHVGNRGECACSRRLPAGGAPADERDGRGGRQTLSQERVRNRGNGIRIQQKNLGAWGFRELGIINARGARRRVPLRCNERELRAKVAMGDRNAGVIGRRRDSGYSGHDLEGNPGVRQLLGFLAAARAEIRVAAHEPHHSLARARPRDQQLGQFGWWHERFGAWLALVNDFSGLGRPAQ